MYSHHFLYWLFCLQVTVSILVVLGAVYTGFRVNGFLRRSGGLCCELHVYPSMPLPLLVCSLCSFSNTLPPFSLFPLPPLFLLSPFPSLFLPFSSLAPLLSPSLFFSSPHFPFTDICLHDGGGMFSLVHCHLHPAHSCMYLLAHLLQSKLSSCIIAPMMVLLLFPLHIYLGSLRCSPHCSSACLLEVSCWCFKCSSGLHYSSE